MTEAEAHSAASRVRADSDCTQSTANAVERVLVGFGFVIFGQKHDETALFGGGQIVEGLIAVNHREEICEFRVDHDARRRLEVIAQNLHEIALFPVFLRRALLIINRLEMDWIWLLSRIPDSERW